MGFCGRGTRLVPLGVFKDTTVSMATEISPTGVCQVISVAWATGFSLPSGRAQALCPYPEPIVLAPFSWICAIRIIHKKPYSRAVQEKGGEMRFLRIIAPTQPPPTLPVV